jgi:hypothetical protein
MARGISRVGIELEVRRRWNLVAMMSSKWRWRMTMVMWWWSQRAEVYHHRHRSSTRTLRTTERTVRTEVKARAATISTRLSSPWPAKENDIPTRSDHRRALHGPHSVERLLGRVDRLV